MNSDYHSMEESIKSRLRPVKKWFRHAGVSRKCPVCGFGSKKFLDFGIVPRPDAECPFCGSMERHRLLWLFLKRKSHFFSSPPHKMLHVAPEPVFVKKFRKLLGDRYITADLLDPRVDVNMDISNIPYPEGTFDVIYCSHVLEHVPDDRKALREIHRVLTNDGMAIIMVPITLEQTLENPSITDPKERLRLFGQEDHVRCYGPDFADRLSEEGFRLEVIYPENFLSPDETRRMGITGEAGEIFLCRK